MSKDKKQDKGIQGNVFDLNIIKRLFQYLKPYKFRFVALVVITCLSSLLVIALPYLTGYSINQVILKKDYEESRLLDFNAKYVCGEKLGEGMHASVYKCYKRIIP